mmetsp:Transcript_10154/g.20971  ORF Transcript_10154/g.20971 Transcript_10154/m.20971 type:complete len:513 (-) Transcript_10154:79-1617(-)|eukprot:CAMPEP_0172439808 /NCGR_PEP_ID=MMETSP1065-20121228/671_1 /TAXON_ID=265537 /ORGANISM="Amphiprora paludosa, Strain CCMP125" /LENGTH=512 /DNA_ID=CAMNT_0013188543 /DNA_START=15 /DNA_END=1553 /DNA_ORIENTATION=+
MSKDSDVALPKALTDFIFDLYDSVTLSQLTEEQSKLYDVDFRELSSKYFGSQPWPSPQSIAAECNGDPLFLAVYREMTHRHWHQVNRPTIRDRIEGWQVYRELFDEILEEVEDANFYLLPGWVFDILQEFGYQFQGFCQVRSAVYGSARKHGLLAEDGTMNANASSQQSNLADNLSMLESSPDAWDVADVFGYLQRFAELGLPKEAGGSCKAKPVHTYFTIFAASTQSRLECLLGDFMSSLQALAPLCVHSSYLIPKDESASVTDTIDGVFPAKLSIAYHTGVSLLMLRRYKDAAKVLGDICATMMRGFKTGQLRKLPGSDQFNKQFERMLSILALLQYICPMEGVLDESVVRSIRDKHGARLEAASTYEDWFQSPKFVSTDPKVAVHRQLVQLFHKEMEHTSANQNLRSYLKLYSSLAVDKLAKFHDMDKMEDILPLLLSHKVRTRQLEREEGDAYHEGTAKDSLDIHYYIVKDMITIDEGEKQRRFENFFFDRIEQNDDILRSLTSVQIA